jgi:hypothetical protein
LGEGNGYLVDYLLKQSSQSEKAIKNDAVMTGVESDSDGADDSNDDDEEGWIGLDT